MNVVSCHEARGTGRPTNVQGRQTNDTGRRTKGIEGITMELNVVHIQLWNGNQHRRRPGEKRSWAESPRPISAQCPTLGPMSGRVASEGPMTGRTEVPRHTDLGDR